MSAASMTDPLPLGRARPGVPRRRIAVAIATALIAAALAVGMIVGRVWSGPAPGSGVLIGRAYHSSVQGAVMVNRWAYGFSIDTTGMDWYDAQGTRHEGGVPPCLQHPGYSWIRFAYTTARGQGGESWRSVTWIQCVRAA